MPKRRVLGFLFTVARLCGVLVIILALLSFPQLRTFAGPFQGSVALLSSVVLLLAGIVWLIVIELFRRFFDQFLSRY